MRKKFFISSDCKVVISLEEIDAIVEDTKGGRDTVGYKEHLCSKGATYMLYLRERDYPIYVDSETMIELLEAIAKYEKGE
jgi:hypothetical protein